MDLPALGARFNDLRRFTGGKLIIRDVGKVMRRAAPLGGRSDIAALDQGVGRAALKVGVKGFQAFRITNILGWLVAWSTAAAPVLVKRLGFNCATTALPRRALV